MNKDDEWKCCDCPKTKASKHDELWSFTKYGNNLDKKEDAILGNHRCEKHFLEKQKELSEK